MRRLKRLGMFFLLHRTVRSDMIEVFKMIHCIEKINLGKLCIHEDGRTRKHSLCLKIGSHLNSLDSIFSLEELLIMEPPP